MTRVERLAQAAARAKAKLAEQRHALSAVQAAQRAVERKARAQRRMQVGTLAEEAGLLALSLADLVELFAALAPLTQVSNPATVIESLLGTLTPQSIGAAVGDETL